MPATRHHALIISPGVLKKALSDSLADASDVRSSPSLFVVAAVTLLSLVLGVIGGTWLTDVVAAGPFALLGFILFTVLQTLLVPVFFAALYVDIGAVRASADPWSPNRWLWVGGGGLASVAAYAMASNTVIVVVPVGLAYLGRRFYAAADVGSTPTPSENPTGDDPVADYSVAGVLVHVLALAAAIVAFWFTSDVAAACLAFSGVAAVVYAASEHSFTRANARNAVNWSLSVLAFATLSAIPTALYAMDGQFYGYTVSGPILPPALDAVAKFGSVALVVVTLLALVATVVFAAFAAWQAALGTPWSYPFAVSVVERLTRTASRESTAD